MEQDHPCVIDIIRRFYLHPPAPLNAPFDLDNPKIKDQSGGQSSDILRHLNHRRDGFFIEAGAYDGESLSNTLFMERYLNWTGILVEANQKSFRTLLKRQRKSYALPVCLSNAPYPIQVSNRLFT